MESERNEGDGALANAPEQGILTRQVGRCGQLMKAGDEHGKEEHGTRGDG